MKENQPLVSIIMPVYNCEKYVSEAIESVCNQSYKNWELLIVDDGSTDCTSKIIDDYSFRDSRIKAFHKKNEGVSIARNFALSEICGEYVTFVDGDDVYHTDRLKRMLHVFEQNENCDIVFSLHEEFKGKFIQSENIGSGKIVISSDNIFPTFISNLKCHYMCNTMIKSEIARKEKFAPIRFGEDFCYLRDCVWHCRVMSVLDEVLYYYRRDNENAMTSHFFSEKYVTDYMKLVENIYCFCKENKLQDIFYRNLVAHEYAHSSMRVRKCTSFSNFVKCMNDRKYREGITFADASQCTLFEKCLFCMVKYKIYLPFAFWIW